MPTYPTEDLPYLVQSSNNPQSFARSPAPTRLPQLSPLTVMNQGAPRFSRDCRQPDMLQHDSHLLTLPNDILFMILELLDPTALELLRRTSRVFLAALPAFYPRLFSSQLQGQFPWPIRRPWTLGIAQRREIMRLVARDSVLHTGVGVGGQSCGCSRCPCRSCDCCSNHGSMLGLTKAWRYLPCARCGRVHPPRKGPRCLDSGQMRYEPQLLRQAQQELSK